MQDEYALDFQKQIGEKNDLQILTISFKKKTNKRLDQAITEAKNIQLLRLRRKKNTHIGDKGQHEFKGSHLLSFIISRYKFFYEQTPSNNSIPVLISPTHKQGTKITNSRKQPPYINKLLTNARFTSEEETKWVTKC